jgi:hypothetical protein
MGEQRMSIPYVGQGRGQDAFASHGTTLEVLYGVLEAPAVASYTATAITGDLSRT